MSAKTEKNQALDALRGLAALAVVFFHFGGKDAPFSFVFGRHGVELFFLISGYVILMSAEKKDSAGVFAKARFLRLFPTFWLCIGFTLTCLFVLGVAEPFSSWPQLVANLIMFPKFFGFGYIDGVYWTLEYELIFYVIVGGLLACRRLSLLVLVLTTASLITSVAYFTDLREAATEWNSIAASIIFRVLFLLLDGKAHLFLLGVLACLAKERRLRPSHAVSLVASIGGIAADERISYPAMAVVVATFAWAVWGAANIRIPAILAWLGAISYPLYLIHMRAGKAILDWFRFHEMSWGLSFVR